MSGPVFPGGPHVASPGDSWWHAPQARCDRFPDHVHQDGKVVFSETSVPTRGPGDGGPVVGGTYVTPHATLVAGESPGSASAPPMDGDRFVPYSEAPERHVYATGGIKDNVGKSRIDLIPRSAIMAAGEILAFGAQKYRPHNWRYGLPWSDTYASLQRHLWAWIDGEDLDKETGKPHLWHGLCQLMFLVEYEATKTGTDDRWSTVKSAAEERPTGEDA